MSEIANNIKKLRQEKQLSLEQVAEQLEVMPKVLECWENGDINPDIQTLTQMANIYDVSVEAAEEYGFGYDLVAGAKNVFFTDLIIVLKIYPESLLALDRS